ncbi:helix-turn-helix domain-containing protein [Winogradskyella flava]|uniref:helix-turn-helix domain-containing protein n=1 Tax=Winogradskyella flava TaxID=1884876 RepID=UPI00248F519A|nr:helix-turn-helix domain-containing protein [Winogradskyella flava]
MSIDLFTFLIDYLFNTKFDTGFITVVALIIIISYLGNYGINQPFVFLSNPIETQREIHKNVFSDEEIDTLKYRIENILHYEKPYLNPELTLKNLANKAKVSDKKLSFFLNQHLETPFYDLINSYRVDEFKEKINLPEYEKYSLVGIAYTCGFNSKSSFYRVFKKETGISPTQFKKNTSNKS